MQHKTPCLSKIALSALVALLLSPATARAQLATGDPDTKFTLETAVMGITTPTDVAPLADGRAIITLKGGNVVVRLKDGTLDRKNTAMAIRWPGTVDSSSEKGLLGVVADPGFDQNRTLYFYISVGDTANKHKVFKATLADDNTLTLNATPIVNMGLEGPANHDGGGLFIHRGQLYVSVGDTGSNATPPTNKYSSCLNKPNGKVLRVNLDGTTPAENPLVGVAMATGCDQATGTDFAAKPPDTRVFAWGLRNPFRIWVDPMTDRLWIGDVGEGAREEVSVSDPIPASAKWPGQHFGYPFREGGVTYPGLAAWTVKSCDQMSPALGCTQPTSDYTHSGGDNCIIGGVIPMTGCGWQDAGYATKYFFGDHGSKRIFTLDVKADRSGVDPMSRKLFATLGGGMSSFRMGADGALYVTADELNALIRIFPKARPASCLIAAPTPDGGTDVAAGTGGVGGGAGGRGGAGGSVADAGTAAGGMGGASSGGGAGGRGGTVGGGGAGGATGTGGAVAMGGAGGAAAGGRGGASATGGSTGTGGSTSTGGSTATGGTAGSGTGGSTPAGNQSADGGCGCSTSGDPGAGTGLVLLAMIALFTRRRHRAPK